MKWIIALLAGAGFWFASEKDKLITQYKIEPVKIAIDSKASKDSFYTRLYYNLTIAFINPSQINGKLTKLVLAMYLPNGKKLAQVIKSEPVQLAANGKTTVKLTVVIPTLTIFDNVVDAIKSIINTANLKLKIIGAAQFSIGTMTINETVPVV